MIDYLNIAKNVLLLEANSILRTSELLTKESIQGVVPYFEKLKQGIGKIIFIGVGKSGIVAKKLAASFTSLGVPSLFLHPTEALHGDLGLVSTDDLLFFISKSGTTEEIVKLLPFMSVAREQRVGLLGNIDSPIGKEMGINFDCSVEKEACLNNQAPTTSTTVALAVGDALAVVYESIVGLSKEGFAINHPGGRLGKALRIKVKDLMIPSDKVPTLFSHQTLKDAILEMTSRPLGASIIVDHESHFIGIVVEGDIRRTFATDRGLETELSSIMNTTPVVISPNELALSALELMEKREKPLALLPVVEDGIFLGLLRLHDLWKEGF